ncbi:MAG: 30S ribosomal protein S7 [Candidatus Jacksonbacteria bacterium RIFOXYC2_FULL_44_29]|nr:MAG: 30S ribosomal protein S7 [Parcubacteria group bacterium GW2011_GWA2_42_28]KKT55131.1 MAG: 30S ribosomal protein S7 [Parcubacteria group bacterium GW2011_GWC2_44_22]OGY75527.1 MAG: 30S ribosomal protein S7 [Candidatus Jacksonbacteria bacterium RIFOXYA2_FULL_43_12]OGY75811.1 MAG: 30S ribosomal protein S7 [Candidatus Jacksonbacteria bacterium RIFOXYB2_FULL_44_15]OGY77871.1 MAG: 30S ribosomal protein S7 [Candidatus Jacksonbacteria bacterium RIFOXYC2_FULL_44_29]OGY80103.1 MAG: 30S ribosomal
MRGKRPKKQICAPDPKFQSLTIAKFINQIMRGGKKATAERIIYDCFDFIRVETGEDPLGLFNKALKNITPDVEVRSRRVGGANYQVPYQVKGDRRLSLALRWLIAATNRRKGKNMSYKLKDEIMAASRNEGEALKFKSNVEKMAEANRAFAHFAR